MQFQLSALRTLSIICGLQHDTLLSRSQEICSEHGCEPLALTFDCNDWTQGWIAQILRVRSLGAGQHPDSTVAFLQYNDYEVRLLGWQDCHMLDDSLGAAGTK